MKRTIVGAIVGGLIIFIWQFLSWGLLDLHRPASQYTPNQDALLQAVIANLPEEGGYIVPNLPENATQEDHSRYMEQMDGKPYASIQYHKAMKANMSDMIMNMIRGLLSNIIMIALLIWILKRINLPRFSTIFTACMFVGLITFINQPYTGNIWYEFFDIWAYLIDTLVSWAACGLWLGWYLARRTVR